MAAPTYDAQLVAVAICACGDEATAKNARGECSACYRRRLGSVTDGFTPTSKGVDMGAGRLKRRALETYAAARAEGIQPAGTSLAQVDRAKRISDATGKAFRADTMNPRVNA